jgi:hypothetical protein
MKSCGAYIFFILLLIFVSACREASNPEDIVHEGIPDSVLSENRMVLIMADIHLLEAGLETERNAGKLSPDRSDSLYSGLFGKYGINGKTYERSLQFYSQDPERFAKMYNRVIALLESQQKRIFPRR